MLIKTFEDGVRDTQLDYMVSDMKNLLKEALSQLEDINTNIEFETVIDED